MGLVARALPIRIHFEMLFIVFFCPVCVFTTIFKLVDLQCLVLFFKLYIVTVKKPVGLSDVFFDEKKKSFTICPTEHFFTSN